MKEKELKELKLTKNIIIPFPNFQQNTIISPTQMNDNFEEIEHAYNTLIDNHNGALEKINKVLSDLTSSDNEAIVNEQERIEAEEIRVNNEEERIANEEERKTEETKRIAMYNVHLNDEIRREQKHIQMVGEFDTKVGEVDTLISTKTEEYNSFVETKTEEYNTFVETKEVEIQNAINSIPPKSELIGEKGDKGDKGEKGDKGDRGEQGLQGIQGIQGLQGVKGDKGDKGEQGIQGLKGDKGDKGDRGEQGVKGDTPSITHLETSINNKIQEVETRFNTLTSTKQQSSEVIDARDGETSLKARLDRDIEKAKQVYVELEGNHISTESSTGAIQDLEILGNTVQDVDNLADIKSVGVLQEDGTYKMSILSCGKNLLKIPDSSGTSRGITFTSKDGLVTVNGTNTGYVGYDLVNGVVSDKLQSYALVQSIIDYYSNVPNFINKPGNYTITIDSNVPNGELIFSVNVLYDNDKHLTRSNINLNASNKFSISVDSHINGIYAGCWYSGKTFDNVKLKVQIEEGTQATPYEPYQENKCDILLPCQLEKVGDVADRLYYDDVEKAWCIEKWQKDFTDLDALNFVIRSGSDGVFKYVSVNNLDYIDIPNKIALNNQLNNKYSVGNPYTGQQNSLWLLNNSNNKELRFSLDGVETNISIYKEALKGVFIKYTTSTPQKIVLPLDVQIQLNSFFGTTHVYMESGEVEGTIKCKIPKSLGATVQSLNNKTDILSDRIEAIEGLKDSQNMKYETDKGYLVCKETKNGVIDDLKLEGKTLVNLAKQPTNNGSINHQYATISTVTNIKPSTEYTYIIRNNGRETLKLYLNNNGGFDWRDLDVGVNSTVIGKAKTLPTIDGDIWLSLNEAETVAQNLQVVLLEGDHTQNPPSYFEGLMSVGQDVDEIEVLSNNGNLVSNLIQGYAVGGSVGNTLTPTTNATYNYIKANAINGKMYYKSKGTQYFVFYTDENLKILKIQQTDLVNLNNDVGAKYIFTNVSNTLTKQDIVITPNSSLTVGSVNHQSNKKQILFYNENGELEPVTELHEWDSIEKHSDNKWYYHKRSGKRSYQTEDENNSNYITDMTNTVYQLAQEEIYELAPLHLDSYANETLILCNSGAISPKMEFSITSHINELIKSQGDRISLLEEKMYKALKQVLAGDMYSLAELLYPEDFVSKEEPIDVPTLLI